MVHVSNTENFSQTFATQCHIRGSEENLEFFTLIEYGANFGHEYYFLAYVHSTLMVYLCLLLVLDFRVLLVMDVSPGLPCVTCNTRKI